jgi:transcriptional regulator with PAS, ATPase and Fis domain
MQAIVKRIPSIAQSDATVLLLGESGTGKELVANKIHQHSKRAQKPFVAINCAALPENLAGSELFGHDRGAFTGAIATKKGKLEMADGGTVLLDEIGDMPLLTQSHLLRFLEEKKFERIGGVKLIETDVRIIAATNRDLAKAIVEGKFREDLFYRLKVASLVLPPLRERREDLAELTEFFLQAVASKSNHNPPGLTDGAWQLLKEYDFPGNVRELQHVVQSAMISAANKQFLSEEDLAPLLRSDGGEFGSSSPSAIALKKAVGDFKREHIQKVLAEHNGNKTHAAKALGISRVHLIKLVKELGME